MECPHCEAHNDESRFRCESCNYGIRSEPRPEKRKQRFLGDAGYETDEFKAAREFRCPCCKSYGAKHDRIAIVSDGIWRLLKFPVREYVVATCEFCGISMLYDGKAIRLSSSVCRVLDSIWSLIQFATIVLAIIFLLDIF